MAALSIELPENVLDALAERVAARVLERLEDGQDGDRWLDAKQAADYLGLSINALHKLTAARQLPAEQEAPGHKLWFRRSQLDHWRSGGHNGAFASKTLPQNSQ
jgi:Helix-turn-helix domain